MGTGKSAQSIIAPLATLLTTFLWLETWVEILAAMPDTNKPRLYRAFDQLTKAKRLTRTDKPRTVDVRYRAIAK